MQWLVKTKHSKTKEKHWTISKLMSFIKLLCLVIIIFWLQNDSYNGI